MRDTGIMSSVLKIFIAATAMALAISGTLRAEDPIAETTASSPSDSDNGTISTPDVSTVDRKLIELNKVLVIPQKCSANDGMMNCDPNEAPSADSSATSDSNATNEDDANSNSSADKDTQDNKAPADAASPATADEDDDGSGAVANAAPASPAAEASPNEPDISNPDTPLPDSYGQGNPTVASNDPNAMTPQYGSLEDYQSQEDAAMVAVPVPIYAGSVYGAGIPTYVNPVGGAYAAARIYTPTYRPPFGPVGPWMTPPSAMFARGPALGSAPMARPAGRAFGFHR